MTLEIYLNTKQLIGGLNTFGPSDENPAIVIGLLTPTISLGGKVQDDFGSEYRELGFTANTELVYRWEVWYKRALLKVLGFGIFISVQTGY